MLKFPYTVVLVFPPEEWEDNPLDNRFVVHIEAEGVREAVKRAQLSVVDEAGSGFRPSDFVAVAVFAGHQKDLLG